VGASANKCRGCHVGYDVDQGWQLNQDFDVVGDYDCNCPDMDYSQEQVCEWVQSQLIDTGKFGDPGLVSTADFMTCWVDDVAAMRSLQNCYYWKYYGDNWANAMSEWAGWNEIGAAPEVDDPSSWQAIMIYLPAQLAGKGLADLDPSMQQEIQDTILGKGGDKGWEEKGWLKIGAEHINERPGSYVVIANEYKDDDPNSPNYNHHFFCQSWTPDVADPQIQICFLARGDDPDGNGYCYLEKASVPCMGSPAPAPAPAPSTDCMTWPGINPSANPIYDASCQPDGGTCCFNGGQSPCRYCNSELCYGQGACNAP
jgi:hypothetical protein